MAEYEEKLEAISNKILFGLQQECTKPVEDDIEDNILNNSLEDLTDEGNNGKINVYTSEAIKKAEQSALEAVDAIEELFTDSMTQFDYLNALKFLFLGTN